LPAETIDLALEIFDLVLQSLSAREPDPLAAPATRGRWRHLWSAAEADDQPETAAPRPSLEGRVTALERELDELKRQMESFRRQFE